MVKPNSNSSSSSSSSSSSLLKNKTLKNKPLAPDDKKHRPKLLKIVFNFETLKWENIKISDTSVWVKAYPACDIKAELNKMKSWLVANPSKRKTRYERFINNWLSRQQDKGGTRGVEDKGSWAERSERKEKEGKNG